MLQVDVHAAQNVDILLSHQQGIVYFHVAEGYVKPSVFCL